MSSLTVVAVVQHYLVVAPLFDPIANVCVLIFE